ncbi:plasmid partitioning protein [Streptomyces sp. NPDC051577]|uniref:ParB/RepB/Spo0J family partition protein n=1 Tax=Streptomyces sp. NPDC051577 TaxID=3155166 RepID=UPI00341632CB
MSKADKLGGGASFQRASAIPVGASLSDRGRAKAVAEGRIPSYSIVRIPLAQVSPTPLNPRRNFGTPEELTRFGDELRIAQLAACVAVTRMAYLALWPDHEAKIGDAEYVLVNGERRFRSARQVDLPALDFVVRDEFADSRADFLNRLLQENIQREDFDVIERATGVQQLVDACAEDDPYGAQSRAAEQLGKSAGWVTNQLALLILPEAVRSSVSSGVTSSRDALWMARRCKQRAEAGLSLDAPELFRLLEIHKAEEAEAKAQKKAILQAAAVQSLTAVNDSPSASPGGAERAESSGTAKPPVRSSPSEVPTERRPQDGEARTPKLLTTVNNSGGQNEGLESASAPKSLTAVNDVAEELRAQAVPHPVSEAALSLRQRLGSTPAEQADQIVEALNKDELLALVEELHERL